MDIKWTEVDKEMKVRVKQIMGEVETRAKSCAVRASNELRNSALFVLRGQRSGKRYKKPHTKRAYYTASAPGEPPAVRTGMLRMSWGMKAIGDGKGTYTAGIYTDVPYAETLESGNSRVKARPYRQKVIERAAPKVTAIFKELESK